MSKLPRVKRSNNIDLCAIELIRGKLDGRIRREYLNSENEGFQCLTKCLSFAI